MKRRQGKVLAVDGDVEFLVFRLRDLPVEIRVHIRRRNGRGSWFHRYRNWRRRGPRWNWRKRWSRSRLVTRGNGRWIRLHHRGFRLGHRWWQHSLLLRRCWRLSRLKLWRRGSVSRWNHRCRRSSRRKRWFLRRSWRLSLRWSWRRRRRVLNPAVGNPKPELSKQRCGDCCNNDPYEHLIGKRFSISAAKCKAKSSFDSSMHVREHLRAARFQKAHEQKDRQAEKNNIQPGRVIEGDGHFNDFRVAVLRN